MAAQPVPADTAAARRFFLVILAVIVFVAVAILAFFVSESDLSSRSLLGVLAVGFLLSELARL